MTLTQIKPAGLSKPIDLADGESLRFGNDNNLTIYHNSGNNNNYISENGTGSLLIQASDLYLTNTTGEYYILCATDGRVELRHDNVKKFETTSAGVLVSGNVYVNDSDKFIAGTSNDLQIYHDPAGGGSSFIDTTGSLQIHTSELYINNEANTERLIRGVQNGTAELYYDGSKKLETTSWGTSITGTLVASSNIKTATDTGKLMVGAGDDLQIYHDGSNSYLKENGTGGLYQQTNGNGIFLQKTDGETMANFVADGAVELYHDNSKRFETTADGIKITPDASGVMISSGGDTNWTTGSINVVRLGSNQADMRLASNYGVRLGLSGNNDANEFQFQQDNTNNAYIKNEASNPIRIQTGGNTTRISVDADGLKFGSDTAAANALADYEEGTWTPTVGGWDTFTPYTSSTYHLGWYTKIGNLVHVGWKIYIQTLSTVSSSAQINIQGLPFNSSSTHAGVVAHVRFDIPEFGFEGYPLAYLAGSSNLLYMNKHVDGGNHLVSIDATANRSGVWTMGTATYTAA